MPYNKWKNLSNSEKIKIKPEWAKMNKKEKMQYNKIMQEKDSGVKDSKFDFIFSIFAIIIASYLIYAAFGWILEKGKEGTTECLDSNTGKMVRCNIEPRLGRIR